MDVSSPFNGHAGAWRSGVRFRDPVDRFSSGEGESERQGTLDASARRQASAFALLRAVPDDPKYQKHVPIEYRVLTRRRDGS